MNIVCLDVEGVLVPEIWIAFSEASGIPELRRTIRDEPDYDKLMRFRLGVLREHGLGLREIRAAIAGIDPLPGARDFLDALRAEAQVLLLSDTFEQFAAPLMEKLGRPTLFCNTLDVAPDGSIAGVLRKWKPALEARIIARSLWLSPAAIVSKPMDCSARTVASLDCATRMR